MNHYYFMTLNAAAMLDIAVARRGGSDIDGDFCFNFTETFIRKIVVDCVERHRDNALFYQIIESVYGKEHIDEYLSNPECIKRKLIYIDFEGIFSPKARTANRKKKVAFSSYEWNDEEIDKHCSKMFQNGFTIIYEDGEEKTYVPFDKSGNMSRNYQISFIDQDIFAYVDERVRLGIDFQSIKVIVSKYFAYRGLYMSDGIRIQEYDGFKLDQNSVLVIPDYFHDFRIGENKQKTDIITANTQLLLEKGILKAVREEKQLQLNSFDGEGIVSPEYAGYMDKAYKEGINVGKDAKSFLIRMPFIKGLLHQVDFHRFYEDNLPEIDSDYYVLDVFGIPRRLKDIQIILTESMFKCTKWLKDYQEARGLFVDPMEWYFTAFGKYDHAMYVCRTDSNMGSNVVQINYQFLHTLKLNSSALDRMIKRHLNEAYSIPETGMKYASDFIESVMNSINEDEFSMSVPAWRYALGLNTDFVRDPFVNGRLKLEEEARLRDVMNGRINVNGSLKYLSGDLLSFLIHTINGKIGVMTRNGFLSKEKDLKNIIKGLLSQVIRYDHFYTADHEELGLTHTRYSLWRNPHLSRNEQCALRPFLPEKEDTKNLYNRYFSHLTNVIMLSCQSTDALALGGADYDGDYVKLILDKNINWGVLQGAYDHKGKDFVRKYPIVVIPSLRPNREYAPRWIPYELAKRTFANRVGYLSNLAIKIGSIEYSEEGETERHANRCAECTLAAGLEIDAVKTGIRPDYSLLEDDGTKEADDYLKKKNLIEEIKWLKSLNISKKKEKGSFGGDVFVAEKRVYTEKKSQLKEYAEAELIPIDIPARNLDRLAGYFLKALFEKREKRKERKNNTGKSLPLFLFQIKEETGEFDYNWKEKIKKEEKADQKLKDLSGLIKAYHKIMMDIRSVDHYLENSESLTYINKVWSLLMIIYDISSEVLPISKTEIPAAIGITYLEVRDCFSTLDEVDDAIKCMKEYEWIFVKQEDKEQVLYRILGKDKLSLETKEILMTEGENGFELLKYFLYEVRNEITSLQSTEDLLERKSKMSKSVWGFCEQDYKAFRQIFIDGKDNNEERAIWKARIIKACRKRLASPSMFDNDFDKAFRYSYALYGDDAGGRFLWEVFQTGEILRNIYCLS